MLRFIVRSKCGHTAALTADFRNFPVPRVGRIPFDINIRPNRFDFVTKNIAMPSDLGELLPYLVFISFVVAISYAIVFAFKFLLSLVKPVFTVLVALFLFKFLSTLEYADIEDKFHQIGSLIRNG